MHFKSLQSLPVLQGQYRLQKGSSEGWLSSQLLAFTCCSARVSNQVPMTLPAWRLGQIADIPAKSKGTVLKGWFIQWKIACIFMFITHQFDLLFFMFLSLWCISPQIVFFLFLGSFPQRKHLHHTPSCIGGPWKTRDKALNPGHHSRRWLR